MIRKAYLKKSKENHPDKNPGDQNSGGVSEFIISKDSIKKLLVNQFTTNIMLVSCYWKEIELVHNYI